MSDQLTLELYHINHSKKLKNSKQLMQIQQTTDCLTLTGIGRPSGITSNIFFRQMHLMLDLNEQIFNCGVIVTLNLTTAHLINWHIQSSTPSSLKLQVCSRKRLERQEGHRQHFVEHINRDFADEEKNNFNAFINPALCPNCHTPRCLIRMAQNMSCSSDNTPRMHAHSQSKYCIPSALSEKTSSIGDKLGLKNGKYKDKRAEKANKKNE